MKVGSPNIIVSALCLTLSSLICATQLTWAQSSEPVTKNQSGPTGIAGDAINAINGTINNLTGGSSLNQNGGNSSQKDSSSNGSMSGLNMFGDSSNQSQGKLESRPSKMRLRDEIFSN